MIHKIFKKYNYPTNSKNGGMRQSNAGHACLSSPQKGKVYRRFNRTPTG